MAYVSAGELIDYLRSTVAVDEIEFEVARLAAESTVDSFCQRTFAVPTTATTRTFVPDDPRVLMVPDIANTTDLVVVNNGATVAAADYQLEVGPGLTNTTGRDGTVWPYMYIRLLSSYWSQSLPGQASVSITARWGWAAVPAEVKLATKMLARDFVLARDTAFGITSVAEFPRTLSGNKFVDGLLADYQRPECFG
jgi:hypothetical protein